MICPVCKGGKTLLKKVQGKGCYEVVLGLCDRCHGTGEIEMTNEEYIRSCSVEELAEFLCKVAMTDILWDRIRQVYYEEGKQAVIEWLKEIHK